MFPASVIFSTDLHSMGQFVQDGARIMFETVVDIKTPQKDFYIEKSDENFDGLNFLAEQNMSVVNRKAMEGTILAHTDGGVPNILLEVDSLTEFDLGYLIYFFEKVSVSYTHLDVYKRQLRTNPPISFVIVPAHVLILQKLLIQVLQSLLQYR